MMSNLNDYIPESAVAYTKEVLNASGVTLKITRGRKSKYGDYRHPTKLKAAQITVNEDLNQYAFLITLIHELAHALSFMKYGRRIRPHGKEWKSTFQAIMNPLLTTTVFPEDLLIHLNRHMVNPKASSNSDIQLFKVLKSYDDGGKTQFLEDLLIGEAFTMRNGRKFIKGNRQRKNFLCKSIDNGKKYLISPIAEVSAAVN